MEQGEPLRRLQTAVGVSFRDPDLLLRAVTHRSYWHENLSCTWGDNERLEYLGDAVANFVAAEYLYLRFPDWQEGQLTDLRAELVCSETLARLAAQIQLGAFLLLGRGEELGGGRARSAMLSDALEALVGAIYLDQGMDAARQFLVPLLHAEVDSLSQDSRGHDAKTRLQEWGQAVIHSRPSYVTLLESGPDHAKLFTVAVSMGDQELGRGQGPSKQVAERRAAQAALEAIGKSSTGLASGPESP